MSTQPQPARVPDVSIIIPTYNRRAYLEQALQSCFTGNDTLAVEIVVVDDGSTDGTRDFLRALSEEDGRVRPIFQEHQGAQTARNRGIDEARGEFVKFLDDDDRLVEGALAEEVHALRRTGSDVSYGNLLIIHSQGEQMLLHNRAHPDLICGIFVGTLKTMPPTFTHRRKVVADVRWRTGLPYYQDIAFALAVASQQPQSVKVERTVAIYQRHDGATISAGRLSVPIEENFHWQARLIYDGVAQLQRHGTFRERHRQAAARGLWQWIHMMAPFDFAGFKRWYEKLMDLDPDFSPPRPLFVLRMLDRLVSPKFTETLLQPFRKVRANRRSAA